MIPQVYSNHIPFFPKLSDSRYVNNIFSYEALKKPSIQRIASCYAKFVSL